ncbi:Plasmodium exported protein, unknown function [Plasmodium vivax]|uniref:Variable surface protein n=1 Tax=Plasmodium vivax TaxID=5855 RepID=A0A565A4P4_PLAVI|nr:Plasmodium exported protein, unknown function [Plasmodium vivax]
MISSSNYYQEINLKFTAFLKTFSFIFLIWTYITYNNMELGYASTGGQLLHQSIGKSKKNVAEDILISFQLNKKVSNNLDTYMKNYKRRYKKKDGLSKLDCYCEKKVFEKLNYIYKISDEMRNNKKGFKKIILKKYGIGFIILTLIPALGLIYHILFGLGNDITGAIEFCKATNHYSGKEHTESGCTALNIKVWGKTLKNIEICNLIYIFTMITIVLLLFIYILRKIIKYEKLKARKGKMNRKVYICFCKEIFNIN